MKRPLADKRPIGPVSQLSGGRNCVLRMSISIRYRSPPTEVTQSLKRGIKQEVEMTHDGLGRQVNVSNVTIVSSTDNRMEIRMDLPVQETSEDMEEEILSSVGAALMDSGAERVDVEDVGYSAVSR